MHFRTLRDNSGGVLISALLIVSLVASIIMLLFSQAMGMQRQMFNQSIRLQAYYAHLGIEQMVAHQLQKLWEDSPSDFFLFDESNSEDFHGMNISYHLSDASACINLNALDTEGIGIPNMLSENQMRNMLNQTLIEFSNRDTLIDSLFDWLDSDSQMRTNGAENIFYLSQNDPYLPANTWLASIDELSLVRGFMREHIEALSQLFCTLPTNIQPQINVHSLNESNYELITLLSDGKIDNNGALSIIRGNASNRLGIIERLLGQARGRAQTFNPFGTQSNFISLNTFILFDNQEQSIESLFELEGDGSIMLKHRAIGDI
jgi:general secretion pathway protein K